MSEKVRDQYDRLAPSYDVRWRSYISHTLDFLLDELTLSGDERALDVACGTGELERRLLAKYPDLDVTGVDFSENMLRVARWKSTANFVRGSADHLPFPNESFDVVVTASSFHFFEDPQSSLREMRRVLKPGGELVVLDWCKDFAACRVCDLALKVLDPAYKRCYYQSELREMLQNADFEVTKESARRIEVIWGIMVTTASRPV